MASGADLGNERYFVVDGLIPDEVPPSPTDVPGIVAELCRLNSGALRWVGLGPPSNLIRVLSDHPHLTKGWSVTQMGGALRYRDPQRAEHNFRLDPAAAMGLVANVPELELVTSDVTFTPELAVDRNSKLYAGLNSPCAAPWGELLRAHLDRWFERFHPESIQHDALTLSAALEKPFVVSEPRKISIDELGRMQLDEDGYKVRISSSVDYPFFMAWLIRTLSGDDHTT